MYHCAKKAYEERIRDSKIEVSILETKTVKIKQIEKKEFVTAMEEGIQLNCSKGSIYYYIGEGIILRINLGKRLTQ